METKWATKYFFMLLVLVILVVVVGFADSYFNKSVSTEDISQEMKWEGEWEFEGSNEYASGLLTITEETEQSFYFTLETINAFHLGNISGFAQIENGKAVSNVGDTSYPDAMCQISFAKENNKITIETTNSDCVYMRGARGFFAGNYIYKDQVKSEMLYGLDSLFNDDAEKKVFYDLIGKDDINLFKKSFEIVEFREKDIPFDTRVYTGKGSESTDIEEGIILIKPVNQISAAALYSDKTIIYFSNIPEFQNTLPAMIDSWSKKYPERTVIFMNFQEIFYE